MCDIWTSTRPTGRDDLDVSPHTGSIYAPSLDIWEPLAALLKLAKVAHEPAFSLFRRAYFLEMRHCYRHHENAWKRDAEKGRIILVCDCGYPQYCHVELLGQLLAKVGGTFHGPLPTTRTRREKRPPREKAKPAESPRREDPLMAAARILGLDKIPSPNELRLAWRRTVVKVHPDAQGGSHDGFIAAHAAYELLREVVGSP